MTESPEPITTKAHTEAKPLVEGLKGNFVTVFISYVVALILPFYMCIPFRLYLESWLKTIKYNSGTIIVTLMKDD